MTLEKKRLTYQPALPEMLKNPGKAGFVAAGMKKIPDGIAPFFPSLSKQSVYRLQHFQSTPASALTLGVFFSGGPAAGGHNVLWGIFETLQKIHPDSRLIGFLGGPSGLVENRCRIIGREEIASIRNQGGFDLIGTGRTKIETAEQMEGALRSSQKQGLQGLVVIGGDDSNTNAAFLAEYFFPHKIFVVGVPKTIDGDLRSEEIEISFGFDSACKTYSELIGNLCRDVLSTKKAYHFVKLMGRSASHVVLECALATQPNLALIGEEKKSLSQIIQEIISLIQRRKKGGKDYGVIVIPEGLVEFVPELQKAATEQISERDPHGNLKLSQFELEKFLISLIRKEIPSLATHEHYFGYEGRCCFPSNFDATHTYALGSAAALAIRDQLTGVILALSGLTNPSSQWQIQAVPLPSLMDIEERNGKKKPVIQKALVDTKGKAFVHFSKLRNSWEIEDQYRMPGPIQFFGESELVDQPPVTLRV